jgi:hypothetical protein
MSKKIFIVRINMTENPLIKMIPTHRYLKAQRKLDKKSHLEGEGKKKMNRKSE